MSSLVEKIRFRSSGHSLDSTVTRRVRERERKRESHTDTTAVSNSLARFVLKSVFITLELIKLRAANCRGPTDHNKKLKLLIKNF